MQIEWFRWKRKYSNSHELCLKRLPFAATVTFHRIQSMRSTRSPNEIDYLQPIQWQETDWCIHFRELFLLNHTSIATIEFVGQRTTINKNNWKNNNKKNLKKHSCTGASQWNDDTKTRKHCTHVATNRFIHFSFTHISILCHFYLCRTNKQIDTLGILYRALITS